MMIRIVPKVRSALIFSLILQTPIILLFSIMLDGGTLGTLSLIAACGYWAGVVLILLRRSNVPTVVDLAFVRWGYLGLVISEFVFLAFNID